MCSVHFVRQGVHRPVSIDTLDGLDAFRLTHLDGLDGKLDGDWTQAVRRNEFLKASCKNCHVGRNFLGALRQGLCCFQMRIDLRVMYPIVACNRLISNAVNIAATFLLPLPRPVVMSSGAVPWAPS